MPKIKIDNATPAQLDYAVAVAQGWVLKTFGDLSDTEKSLGEVLYSLSLYHPTADDTQCGKLIDEFEISTNISADEWMADAQGADGVFFDKSRRVAACKALLWSKYPDGLIEVQDDK